MNKVSSNQEKGTFLAAMHPANELRVGKEHECRKGSSPIPFHVQGPDLAPRAGETCSATNYL